MLDESVPRLPLTLDEMVEIGSSVNHCQGAEDLPNGDEGEAGYGVEEGNALLETGEEVELD